MFSSKKRTRKKMLFASPGKRLKGAALRALEEAFERRRARDPAREISGDCPHGRLEPTRYGDWESRGKCSDF